MASRGTSLVYVDKESIYGEEYWSEEVDLSYEESEEFWAEFKFNIFNMLPKSFDTEGELYFNKPWISDDDAQIYGHNSHYWLVLAENEGSVAVCLAINPDAPGFVTEQKLAQQADKLFDAMLDFGFKLNVRYCQWTQRNYQRSKVKPDDLVRKKHKATLRELS